MNRPIEKSKMNEALDISHDREGSFEPVIVAKKQNRIEGLDQKILSLYAKGMSLSDIKKQVHELYEADISESLISKITDGVLDEVRTWQSRPLETLYPVVFFDCLVVKVRHDKRIINKAIYVAEAITAVYPKCEHQLCIVHQIRDSLTYVSYKDRKELASDLKPIYQACSEEAALLALEAFETKWGSQYPHITKSWYHHWGSLITFLQYPLAIRKIIYTTNSIGTPSEAWLNKEVQFFPGEGVTARPELSFAPNMVTC